MKRKIVNFTWDDEDAQKAFTDWHPFPNRTETSHDVDRIEAFASLTPPMRVLDIGCGNGRHSIEMARRGYQVVGIDIARLYLSQARENLRDSGLEVDFRLQRGSELRENEFFDFVLAYWHTIGFMSHSEIQSHFRSIYIALKPKAPFLFVFQGPKLISGQENESCRDWGEKNDKFILTEKAIKNGFRDENCVVINTVSGEIIEYREHQRAMRYEEIMGYLQHAGFYNIETYSDFEKSPATQRDFSIFLCVKG